MANVGATGTNALYNDIDKLTSCTTNDVYGRTRQCTMLPEQHAVTACTHLFRSPTSLSKLNVATVPVLLLIINENMPRQKEAHFQFSCLGLHLVSQRQLISCTRMLVHVQVVTLDLPSS